MPNEKIHNISQKTDGRGQSGTTKSSISQKNPKDRVVVKSILTESRKKEKKRAAHGGRREEAPQKFTTLTGLSGRQGREKNQTGGTRLQTNRRKRQTNSEKAGVTARRPPRNERQKGKNGAKETYSPTKLKRGE